MNKITKYDHNMRRIVTLCLGIGFLYACSSGSGKRYSVPDINIEESNDIVFALDDSTVQNMEYLQLFQRNDSDILAFTNQYDNAIVYYDYKTKQYLGWTEFSKQGNNGIGTLFSFCYLNPDSIYLYNFTTYTLFLANSQGEVLEKNDLHVIPNLSADSLFFAPQLFPRTNSPLQKVGNELILAGFYMNEQTGENSVNRPVLSYYDLSSKNLRFSDSYPSMYHRGNWGGDFTYRNPFYTLSASDEIVLGFAADHNIRVHAKDEATFHEYYAGVGGDFEITPITDDIGPNTIAREKVARHYINTLSYQAIVYDKYRKVYYRLALLPDSDIDINAVPIRKPIEIVVLNDRFELIGKGTIKRDRYWINQCFVSPDGFHIQVESDNDDELRFKTFVLGDY